MSAEPEQENGAGRLVSDEPCSWVAQGDERGQQIGKAWCVVHDHDEGTSAPAGWLDPPNPSHSCHDEMPGPLTREDWRRRWRCSCGRVYRVLDSQRDGFHFAEVVDGT